MYNPLSYSSLRLELFSKEGGRLKSASGFVVEAGDKYYLITNWHVVSGRDVRERELEEPVIGPYMLKTSLHIHSGHGEQVAPPYPMGIRQRITVELYDETSTPRWIAHQENEQHQPMVDIVALPIQMNLKQSQFIEKIIGMTMNMDYWWSKISAIPFSAIDTDVEYGPPDTVYVIGYPLGWAPTGTDKSSAAFWRTSSIASEINEMGMIQPDTFFVDPHAIEGMTGSPVIGMKNNRIKLLGVYSDNPTPEFGANAGLVWKASLLKELIGTS